MINACSINELFLSHTLCLSLQDHYFVSKQIDECQGVRPSVRFVSKDLFTLGEGQGEQERKYKHGLDISPSISEL